MILCGLLLTVILMVAGIGFGIHRYRDTKAREAVMTEGIAAVAGGDYEAAIGFFDQVLEKAGRKLGKLETDALLFRAEAEYQQADYAAALHTYELLLEEDPDHEAYKMGAAQCLMELGDCAAAMSYEVLQGRIYARMAKDQIEAGQYESALESIDLGRTFYDEAAARELDYNEAVVYEFQGDYAKALELFEAYVQKYGSEESVQREITFLKTRQE